MDTMKRPTHLIRCLVVSVSLGAAGGLVFTDIAAAQQRTLLDMLFGARREVYRENTDRMIFDENNRPVRPSKNRTTKRAERPRTQPAAPANQPSAPADEPVIPSKLADAKTILVVGDFMASGLAEGLNAAFMDSPGVRVVDKSDGSSGFVRSDHRNWPGTIASTIDAEKPAIVVMMIGANDRQQFVNGPAPQSDAWTKEYQGRINAFLEAVKKTGHPVVWVGQPSFKFKNMSTDLLAFNELYRNATEKADGKFVDVWEGFVDQSGSFTLSGFDVSGQTVRLRNNDGVGLTTAGKRKLAFYAEKPLRQMLGNATSPAIAAVKPGSPVQALPETPQAPVKVDRIAPISLSDPELDGGTDLLGAAPKGTAVDKPAPDKLLKEGAAPISQPGRINDYAWPAKSDPAAK